MWRAKLEKTIPRVLDDYPKSRFIFLTLTARNCEVGQLRDTLVAMNAAWNKLTKRKEFPATGWFRAVEVTRGQDDTAHPHFHCVLMVNPGYFSTGYISQTRWVELWQSCLRISYPPIVDVRTIGKHTKEFRADQEKLRYEVMKSLVYTLKYTAKAANLSLHSDQEQTRWEAIRELHDCIDEQTRDWLVQITGQLHKTRAIATGGILRRYLKELEDERADMIHTGNADMEEENADIDANVRFSWDACDERYKLGESVDGV